MVMTARWVRYGQDAALGLRDEIRRVKGTEPLAPVTVVVPSNQVGVSARRQLASGSLGAVCGSGPGLVGVTFLTPYRLAELLGAAALAGTGRRPVSTPVLAAAMRAALTEEPGLFDAVARHPSTEAALVASYRELRDLSPVAISALAQRGRRAADVVRLHRMTRSRLAPDWYDEEDLMVAAAEVLEDQLGTAGLGALVVHLPQRLSRHAADLLRAMAATTDIAVLAGTTGEERADAEVTASVARLAVDLVPPTGPSGVGSIVSVEATSILTASDSDDEVRGAVRVVMDEVSKGTALDRIAVLYATPEPYSRLVHDHLSAAGIATNGTADVPVAGRLAGRALLHLLELPTLGFRRQDVFAWLTGAPILHKGRWAPLSAWERLSRDAGVVSGRGDWDRLLSTLAVRLEAEAASAGDDPESPPWLQEKLSDDAERARQLRVFVLDLIDRLDEAAAQPQPWGVRCTWAIRLLGDILGGANRRLRWPAVERKAAERVDLALRRLGALDAVEGPVPLEVFTRTLAIELESDLGRVGRFGEGVLVGSVSMAVGLDLDLVVLLGLAEGTFPTTVHDDSLLPDVERAAALGELPQRAEQVHRLHRQFLAALAGASRHVLGVPRGDLRRSADRVPSRWVLDVATELAGERWYSPQLLDTKVPWVLHVESFDDGLRRLTVPATAQEHRLRSLLAAAPARGDLHATAAAMDDVLAAGVEALDARSSADFTRFDGNLAGLAIPSPVDVGSSATSLERWADCPHAYLLQNLLRVQPVEQPENLLQITPLERGRLVHTALERFILEVLDRPPADQPAPDQEWSATDVERVVRITEGLCDEWEDQGLTGRAIFWRRDRVRIVDEMRRFLAEDTRQRKSSRTRPVAAELAFGLRQGLGPVAFPLPDGRSIPMRGMADRVDVAEDGTIHVLDYKTGKADSYKKLSETDPHQRGTRLQLAVYGEAARQHQQRPDATVEAAYWFVSRRGAFQRFGYCVNKDVVDRVGEAMLTIVSGIEDGLFVPHPKPPTTSPFPDCAYCDPDRLGTAELRRQWERKVGDPNLASYLDLTESVRPDDDENPTGTT